MLQSGVENVTTSARHGVDDTRHYLKSTSNHIKHLLVENYNELNLNLKKSLDDTAVTVVKQLEDTSKAVKLKQLNTFVEKLPIISRDLERMKSLTNEMRTNASELNDGELIYLFQKLRKFLNIPNLFIGLRSVKNKLLQTLKSCTTRECKAVEDDYEIGRLDQNGIDYDQVRS
jgi:prominin 1